jgi:hypothetical protein
MGLLGGIRFIYTAIRSVVAICNGEYWQLWISLWHEIISKNNPWSSISTYTAMKILMYTVLLAFTARWSALCAKQVIESTTRHFRKQ